MPEREKPAKSVEEMTDRELAEHALGSELVERLHSEFDLRDTNEEPKRNDFTPPR